MPHTLFSGAAAYRMLLVAFSARNRLAPGWCGARIVSNRVALTADDRNYLCTAGHAARVRRYVRQAQHVPVHVVLPVEPAGKRGHVDGRGAGAGRYVRHGGGGGRGGSCGVKWGQRELQETLLAMAYWGETLMRYASTGNALRLVWYGAATSGGASEGVRAGGSNT